MRAMSHSHAGRAMATAAGAILLGAVVAGCGSSGGSSGSDSATGTDTAATASASPTASDNGEASKSAADIQQDAVAALNAASSVHLTATGTSDGKPIKLDLKFEGDNTSGSVTQAGVTFDLIKIGDDKYIKGDAAAYDAVGAQAVVGQLVGDKWLKLGADQAADFSTFSKKGFADQIGADTSGNDTATVTAGEYNGRPVAVVKGTDSTNYVASTGEPYLLHTVSTGTDSGTFDFTEYNATFEIAAPADVVDLPSS